MQRQGVEVQAARRIQPQPLQPAAGSRRRSLQVGQGLQAPAATARAAATTQHHPRPPTLLQGAKAIGPDRRRQSLLVAGGRARQGHQTTAIPELLQLLGRHGC